jgi:ribosomal protein S18 acetylase RimI-like enzyme
VRPFRDDDRAACLQVFDSNVPTYSRPAERVEFESFLDDVPGPYSVVDGTGSVVGCGGYALRPGEAVVDLCWGMIHAERHERGLGARLTFARLEHALRNPSVQAVALSTSQRTVGFYEKLGFRLVSVEKDGYADGLDRCEMRLELGSEGEGGVRPRPD